MIYTTLTNKAMRLAYTAHHGQLDKGGQPYIFHPYHVAEQMEDETTVCVAMLHDILEDTPMTFNELSQEFPEEVVEAVRLLTYTKNTDYFDYIRQIRQNPIAKKVKIADILHNADQTRLAGCTAVSDEQRLRWQSKYRKALDILKEE